MQTNYSDVIEKELTSWDGKSAKDITAIYLRHCNESRFTSTFIDLIQTQILQIAATWLLKHHLIKESGKISKSQIVNIFQLLPEIKQWQSKLHLLQCLSEMPIALNEKKIVEHFLRHCLSDNNKFVRAWAYHGYYVISLQYPEYKQETLQFFKMAMRDEAASVKARIRNILKKGDFVE